MSPSLLGTCSLTAIAGLVTGSLTCAPAVAALAPATFEEYVGIGRFSAQGADPHIAESVMLSVAPADWEYRGGGTGYAWINPVIPVSTGAGLDIVGGSNMSGIGATAATTTTYEFTPIVVEAGAPAMVELVFTGFASVEVHSNQPVGHTFARISINGIQFQVDNYDAQGAYTGSWQQQWQRHSLGFFAVGAARTISLEINSHGQGAGAGYYFQSAALIDPLIEVVYPTPGSYRIDYSPGIQPAIPEPATWASLVIGLATLVGWRRRRHRQA